jgi:hypothetical protein
MKWLGLLMSKEESIPLILMLLHVLLGNLQKKAVLLEDQRRLVAAFNLLLGNSSGTRKIFLKQVSKVA